MACKKHRHPTEQGARVELAALVKKRRVEGQPIVCWLAVYRCAKCQAWHVGSQKRAGINWDAYRESKDVRMTWGPKPST